MYAAAIKRLADHPWSQVTDLCNILSVLRGPDSDDEQLKETHTAPLRLYLLGIETYKEAGYSPSAFKVSRELPSVSPNNHFNRHICLAINIIRRNGLPAADSEA